MNFHITQFQIRVLKVLAKHPRSTTYELSKRMRKGFWKVRAALLTLWWKGFIHNDNKQWRLWDNNMEEETYGTASF